VSHNGTCGWLSELGSGEKERWGHLGGVDDVDIGEVWHVDGDEDLFITLRPLSLRIEAAERGGCKVRCWWTSMAEMIRVVDIRM